jgi:hypothetical protein
MTDLATLLFLAAVWGLFAFAVGLLLGVKWASRTLQQGYADAVHDITNRAAMPSAPASGRPLNVTGDRK